eukprot:366454-Chlamydomonas_euryale.AAC.4
MVRWKRGQSSPNAASIISPCPSPSRSMQQRARLRSDMLVVAAGLLWQMLVQRLVQLGLRPSACTPVLERLRMLSGTSSSGGLEDVLAKDPYAVLLGVPGITFADADTVAANVGTVDPHLPSRGGFALLQVCVCMGAQARGRMGTWAHGRVGAWAHSRVGASAHRRMGAWVHGRVGAWAHSRAWAHGRMVVWAHLHIDAWAHGRMGAWAHGRMGAWARGRMGAWVSGRMCEWVHGRMGAWVSGRMCKWVHGRFCKSMCIRVGACAYAGVGTWAHGHVGTSGYECMGAWTAPQGCVHAWAWTTQQGCVRAWAWATIQRCVHAWARCPASCPGGAACSPELECHFAWHARPSDGATLRGGLPVFLRA